MEISFREFRLEKDKPTFQITGTVNGMCISDHYNRDSPLWRFHRWRAEKNIIRGFIYIYKKDIKEAYKDFRTKE